MNLIVEIGNSFIKTAVFSGNKIISNRQIALKEFRPSFFPKPEKKFKSAIISSVIGPHPELDEIISEMSDKFIHFDVKTPVPVKISYQTPETLGKDRLALAAGATMMYPGKNVLIVDAGTCLTFDFVHESGAYLGGSIHPGLNMRFKSLNSFTARLPLIRFDENYEKLTGESTTESILSGVQIGFINEVQSFINAYKKEYGKIKVVLTGGDFAYLYRNLKKPIIADKFFLLKCLNKILLFNV